MLIRNRIPDVVIKRLATYLRILKDPSFASDDEYVSSAVLGEASGVNSAQVRKDLALFGEFGKQGVGYPITVLTKELVRILGADRDVGVAILGVGELGTALARYLQSKDEDVPGHSLHFPLRALFDVDPDIVGKKIGEVEIMPLSSLEKVTDPKNTLIGIITVPATAAQDVVDFAISKGIKGFLNFAPVKLKVPPNIRVQYNDVTLTLQELAFYL